MLSSATYEYGLMAGAARLRTPVATNLAVAGPAGPAAPVQTGTCGTWSLKPASPVTVRPQHGEFAGAHLGATDRLEPRPKERSP